MTDTYTGVRKKSKPVSYKSSIAFKLKNLGKEIWRNRISYLFITPFMLCFTVFIVIPVVSAAVLGFTYYNVIELPKFIGWENFRYMLTEDEIFLKHAIPNTFKFALFVGPIGYFLAFFLAWLISVIGRRIGTLYTIAIYMPSVAGPVMMAVVWKIMFSNDRRGYLNSLLLRFGFIDKPIGWLLDSDYILTCMIFVTLWGSFSVGFLSMLAGLRNVDRTLYEAAYIDGMRNRFQEIWYITIPQIMPQMLFAVIMQVIGALRAGSIATKLTGRNPTPNYAGTTLMTHMNDYGFIRYELGYAVSISFFLLLVTFIVSRVCFRLLGSKEDK